MLDENSIQELRRDIEELKNLLTQSTTKRFLELTEAAEYLKISKSAMQKISARRLLPVYKPTGGKVYFSMEDLDDFITSGAVCT